ncbi:MAG: hypothetical protein HQK88_10775 [Nitrospirae bacterium]|nr:hypothetical protein [Nitrospirota bacterium]MBF0535294.1 hypothetical protein [Nitrospirota bacterium]MBF0617283.1 hypothetical protein [Nitrospirota bacterium]
MSIFGEVSIKVKRAILDTGVFTVSKIAMMTDSSYTGVESVVRRLLKDGIIEKTEVLYDKVMPDGTNVTKGRPKQHYKIAGREMFVRIRDEVETFFRTYDVPGELDKEEPENPHYAYVVSNLRELEEAPDKINDETISIIEEEILFARKSESIFNEHNEITFAYIDFLQARFEFLRNDFKKGNELADKAYEILAKHNIPKIFEIENFIINYYLKIINVVVQKACEKSNYESLSGKLDSISNRLSFSHIPPSVTKLINNGIENSHRLNIALISEIKEKTQLLDENVRYKIELQFMDEINNGINSGATINDEIESQTFYNKYDLLDKMISKNKIPYSSYMDTLKHRA